MPENPLKLLMNPKSIAVVGANNDPRKMGTIQTLSILKDGYKGKFYPIHLTEKTVLGYKAYAAAEDLPQAPDLVVFIVPNKAITDLLEGRADRSIQVVSACFSFCLAPPIFPWKGRIGDRQKKRAWKGSLKEK